MRAPSEDGYTVGVIGAGAMGQGIAQVAIQGGLRTFLYDSSTDAAAAAKSTIFGRLQRSVEKGRLTTDEAHAAIERLEVVAAISSLSPCDAVIEAIVENLEIKRAVFRDVESVVGPDCLLASNTSSIPIAAIAQGCQERHRIGGMHFFNPVPVMRLVEVIRAAETSDLAVERMTELGKAFGRTPVAVQDSPGFLVNMGGRAYTTEAMRVAHEGVASPAEIDAIMRDAWHFPMGPFELNDLTGMDVNFPVSNIVYQGYFHDPRLKTSANHAAKFEAGTWGRKTGSGWFSYAEGAERPSPDFVPTGAPSPVCLAEDSDPLRALADELRLNVKPEDGTLPILAAPVGEDATRTAIRLGMEARRLVCVDPLGDRSKRVTLMTAPGAHPRCLDSVAAGIVAGGRVATAIKDSPGFVGQRIAAMVANLGCYMAEIGLAAPEDIDLAMTLGLNYPQGPLALVETIGAERTHTVLASAQTLTGEDRYRPTLWLSRRAALGLPIHTPN